MRHQCATPLTMLIRPCLQHARCADRRHTLCSDCAMASCQEHPAVTCPLIAARCYLNLKSPATSSRYLPCMHTSMCSAAASARRTRQDGHGFSLRCAWRSHACYTVRPNAFSSFCGTQTNAQPNQWHQAQASPRQRVESCSQVRGIWSWCAYEISHQAISGFSKHLSRKGGGRCLSMHAVTIYLLL